MTSLLAVALTFSSVYLTDDPETVRIVPQSRPVQPQTAAGASVVSQGLLGRETVRYYVQLHRPAVRFCYQQELGRQPGLTTSLAVSFTIAPDGRVSSLEEGKTALARCVGLAVSKIRFPSVSDLMSDGTTRPSLSSTGITYRFAFRPAPKDGQRRAARAAEARPPEGDPDADGPKAPAAAPAAAPPAGAASQPAPAPAGPRPAGRRGPARRIDTRHGDDPLRGIPAGDAL